MDIGILDREIKLLKKQSRAFLPLMRFPHHWLAHRFSFYRAWHLWPWHPHFHLSVLLVYILMLALAMVSFFSPIISPSPKVRAATYTKTWTSQSDFESNAVTNDPSGTIGTPTTTRTNVNTSGTPGSVGLTSVGATIDDISGLGCNFNSLTQYGRGLVATGGYLYTLQDTTSGAGCTRFLRYDIANNNWSTLTHPTGTVLTLEGYYLATDGTYIFMQENDSSTTFYRYTISSDSWTNLNNAPTDATSVSRKYNAVITGGNYYAPLTNDTTNNFRAYSISGNSWSTKADAPWAFSAFGKVVTDGTYIYATKGNSSASFARYTISSNTWSDAAVTDLPAALGTDSAGHTMTFLGDYIYLLKGSDSTTVYRYSISGNSWSTLNPTPTAVYIGGGITNDGTNIYALRGNTSYTFWIYDQAADSFTTTIANNGTIAGLKINAAASADWSTLSWSTSSLPAGTSVRFRTRGAATEGGLSSASWSSNITTSGSAIATSDSVWLEAEMTLVSSGAAGPTLTDFTIVYVQNGPPEIQSVSASQGSDGVVTASYQPRDSDTVSNAADITLQYNIGAGWSNATTVSGQVGANVSLTTSYATKTISWTAKTDANNNYTASAQVRVLADDKEPIFNTVTSSASSAFTLDTKNPTSPTARIVAKASGETVNLASLSATDDSSLAQMLVSNSSAFSGASYQTYASTVSDWNLGGGTTVYVKYKDAKGNESASVSATLPSNIPQSVVITDLSNPSTGDCRNSLGFTALSTVSSYSIDRSTDNSNWTLEYATISDINKPGFIDYGLDSGTTYYYRVHSRDSSSNASYASATVSKKPCQADNVAPTISSVTVKSTSSSSATITWTTDEKADSYVEYGLDNSYGTIVGKNDSITTHEVALPSSLSSATTYHFRARSRDAAGNLGASGDNTLTTAQATTADPTATPADISSASVSDVTLTSALVTWETSAVATSVVDIGSSTSYGTRIEDKSLSSTTKHTVKFSDLKDSTTYHFRISGTDATGKKLASDDYTFSTLTLPVVSQVAASNAGSREITINWETNTATDSFVEYKTGSEAAREEGKSESTKKHSLKLENLNPKTTYTYRVKSRDSFGNLAASEYLVFATIIDTTPPKITDVKAETSLLGEEQGKAKVQAIISWTTDEPATAQIQYSLGVIEKGEYQESTKEDISLSQSHVSVLQNLLPSATYRFRVISKDASSNIASSDDYSILTVRKTKSLITTIVEVLEDTFSWVKLIKLR